MKDIKMIDGANNCNVKVKIDVIVIGSNEYNSAERICNDFVFLHDTTKNETKAVKVINP